MNPRRTKGEGRVGRVSVPVPRPVIEWLEARATRAGRSKADVVRELIEQEMAREGAGAIDPAAAAATGGLTDEDREDRRLLALRQMNDL